MRLVFKNSPQIMAGISERSDGSMVWWNRLPVDEGILKNREKYFKAQGINPERVAAGGIAHGVEVAAVGEDKAGKYLISTAALITNVVDLFLTITVADCLPVYFYDPKTQSIGLAHAGWRGLIGGILENVVLELQRWYGCQPNDLRIIIGPHIRSCHYEVHEEVAEKFKEQNIEHREGRIYVKLADEAKSRLRELDVGDISTSPICIYEDQRFYSARRDKAEPLQGMVAYIGLRN